MRSKLAVLVAILALGMVSRASPEQITRVGILNIEKVYTTYFRESKTVRDFQARQTAVVQKLKALDEEILKLESEKLEAEGRGDMELALKKDTEIFKRKQHRDEYRRVKTQQLRRLSESLYQSDDFLDELLAAISYVAESEGYSLVLNNSKQFSQFFFFYAPEIDITEKVIQELMRRAGREYSSEG